MWAEPCSLSLLLDKLLLRPCLFILLTSEVLVMGPPGAHLSTSMSSSLLHLLQAVLGLEVLLHPHTICAPSMHLPGGCSLLPTLHTCPEATPASLPAIINSSSKTHSKRVRGVFQAFCVPKQ